VIVRTEKLMVRYGTTLAVDGVELIARPGSILGVIGPNGSGKSSLVKSIAGVVRADGDVLFDDSRTRPDRIGYMPQDVGGNVALTVMEVVLLGRLGRLGLRVGPDDLRAVSAILSDLDIAALASRYLGELSGGQRQMVFLAQAFATESSVLLLDEPISALDIRHQLEVLECVSKLTREQGLTTICVLHDLNAMARFADQVALMCEGRLIACGSPRDILTASTIAEAFEIEARVTSDIDGLPTITPLRPIRHGVAG
jgi:iron complex transport system ATP-binding protein